MRATLYPIRNASVSLGRELILLSGPHPVGGYDRLLRNDGTLVFLRGAAAHRLDGPAVLERRPGFRTSIEWRVDGYLHREDGPAAYTRMMANHTNKYRHISSSPGERLPTTRFVAAQVWARRGEIRRDDGPAIVWRDGTLEWFRGGRRGRATYPAVLSADGAKEWHGRPSGFLESDLDNLPSHFDTTAPHWYNSFHRDVGPTIITGGGIRIWGTGSWVDDSISPPVGPWVEYADGSMRLSGSDLVLGPSNARVIEVARAGRSFVERRLRSVGIELEQICGRDAGAFEDRWRSAAAGERRELALSALAIIRETEGNLPREEERAMDRWILEFGELEAAERHEIDLRRDDMSGYLAVALRRLPSRRKGFEQLATALADADLPVLDSAHEVSSDSSLVMLVCQIPSVEIAIPELPGPEHLADPTMAKKRTARVRGALYSRGVAEVALAVLAIARRLAPDNVDSVLLNLMADQVNPTTGNSDRVCILSVRTTWDSIDGLQLEQVDPQACVRGLGGATARPESGVQAVRPVVKFDFDDVRLIASQSVTADLDAAPNLMQLTPTEFETLVQNLFEAIGLTAQQTRASRDGGVDCIAYDDRPVFGGKLVIQAKRYKNTVGVSAVRDLYGTMLNEGAMKGILVTTSGYGRASFEFAANKPIELLEGSHLLHLLEHHLDLRARIEPPDDWREPDFDE